MNRRTLSFILVICLLFMTGCWDRTELNDLALELGWGLDLAKNNQVEISSQFIVPSKLTAAGQSGGRGGVEKSFFVESGIGTDTLQAVENMQAKVSRRIFRGHRRVIVIGEALAKHGLLSFLDTYSRDPEVRLRADIFVVKGDTAKRFLETSYPLESIPAQAALKLHKQIGGLGDVAFKNFLADASTEGSCPVMPVMKILSNFAESDEITENTKNTAGNKGFAYSGSAVFNQDLKLVGYLNPKETKEVIWIKGQLKFLTLTGFISQANGNVSLDLTKLGNKIQPTLRGNTIKISVILTGQGLVRENTTNLDLTQAKNIQMIENALNNEEAMRVEQVVKKVQQEYGTDIFGFNQAIHRKYPDQWKMLKKNWDKEFSKVEVTVQTHLTVRRVGLTGPGLQLRENKIKK